MTTVVPIAALDAFDEGPPRADELRPLMSDVCYEHEMYGIADRRARDLGPQISDAETRHDDLATGQLAIERNAWLEVALLHLRNLIAFYVSKPIRDDVVAGHYVDGWTAADGGASLAWLVSMTRSLHKRHSHITAYRHRVSFTDDQRLLEEIRDHLEVVFHAWWERLSSEQQSWFELLPTREPGS